MLRTVAIAVLAAGIAYPLTPYAQDPAPGQQCMTWHATAQDSNGRMMTCTHTPDSGNLMYWEYGGAQDSAWVVTR